MKPILTFCSVFFPFVLFIFGDAKKDSPPVSSPIDASWSIDLSSKKIRCKIENRGDKIILVRPQIQVLRRTSEANPQIPPQKETGVVYPFIEIVTGSDVGGGNVNLNSGNPPETVKIAVGETKEIEETLTTYFEDAPGDLKKIKSIRAGILLNGTVAESKEFTYAGDTSK